MAVAGLDVRAFVAERLVARNAVSRALFDREARRLAGACEEMSSRFLRGGRLLAFGRGAAATDAQHVSVEFVHPVIVGKRALPALDISAAFEAWLPAIARDVDIAMGFCGPDGDAAVAGALANAASMGTQTFALPGPRGDFAIDAPSPDPFVSQEIVEILYHTLWETVHVFFEHSAALKGPPHNTAALKGPPHNTAALKGPPHDTAALKGPPHDTAALKGPPHDTAAVTGPPHDTAAVKDDLGATAFLYPFLDDRPQDTSGVIDQVAASIRKKAADDERLREEVARDQSDHIAAVIGSVLRRLQSGATLLIFGNGGSATDANDWAIDCVSPPPGVPRIRALSLAMEPANVTAIANDVGTEVVFLRQLIAHGRRGDVAIAISTSGGSANVMAALEEARKRGMLTVALLGYDGGEIVRRGLADLPIVVHCDYIPRIQEVQASIYHVMTDAWRRLLRTRA